MNAKRALSLLLSAALLIWPLIIDGQSLAEHISPASVTSAGPFVFWLKASSLLAGGLLGAVNLIKLKKLATWQLWSLRILVALFLAGVFFYITFMLDFQRDYVF